MNRHLANFAAIACFSVSAAALAQQQPPPPPPPEAQRVDAKREVIINWTLGDQAWNFNDVRATYEPVKGHTERTSQGTLAVWKLRLVKDLEPGAATLHEKTLGSPFRVVLLDAERTIINPDLPAQITPVTGVRKDDTIELFVALPDAPVLNDVKTIRVERRTNVGF